MFNNPFDSFHNTVAEAKEEREQLDRLLTISTPRERLLVAGIAVLLCVLAAWLFLGSVARNVAVDGLLVEPRGDRSVYALVWVEGDVASDIEADMPAVIELDGEELHGEVAGIGAVRVTDVMAAFASKAPVSPHSLEIALGKSLDLASLAGKECRIVIALGRQSPIALFGMRRP